MDFSEYYSSYVSTAKDNELHDAEYDYYPYSSNEIDYLYNDNPQHSYEYETDGSPTHFSTKPKYLYPKSKRKHHFR